MCVCILGIIYIREYICLYTSLGIRHHDKVMFIPGIQGWFDIQKPTDIIHHIKINKGKKSYNRHLNRC